MEKDIGKIPKNDTAEIIVRIDDFGGKRGLTVREFVTSDKYTGFTKAGVRIPSEHFLKFREMINSISLDEMTSLEGQEKLSSGKKEKKIPDEEVQDY